MPEVAAKGQFSSPIDILVPFTWLAGPGVDHRRHSGPGTVVHGPASARLIILRPAWPIGHRPYKGRRTGLRSPPLKRIGRWEKIGSCSTGAVPRSPYGDLPQFPLRLRANLPIVEARLEGFEPGMRCGLPVSAL